MDPRDCRTKKLVCSSFSVEKWSRLGIYHMADNRSTTDIENHENSNSDSQITPSNSTASSRIRKAFEIEDACYSYLKNKLKRK